VRLADILRIGAIIGTGIGMIVRTGGGRGVGMMIGDVEHVLVIGELEAESHGLG